jgi:leucyl-tRNA---protein transferase
MEIVDYEGLIYVNEKFYSTKVSTEELDALLAEGWRHFGTYFFRYSLSICGERIYRVIPLRIRLENFSLSKSQRRVVRKNSDLRYKIAPIKIDAEKIQLFDRHKTRFKDNIPDSIYTFLSPQRGIPCETMELDVFLGDKLLASSFFDVGKESISSVYAIFEPEEKKRSLGIFTMLLEIDFAIKTGKKFYYHGYAHQEESFYDYKKRFHGIEAYDWKSKTWRSFR